jgi:putative MATE family efflux protein
MVAFHVLIGVVQGEGLMKYMMIAMVAGNLLNIILDAFFILEKVGPFPGLGMGVSGAALATVIGQTLAGFYLIWVFAAGKTAVPVAWKIRHIRLGIIGQIVNVGLPGALSQMLLAVSFLVVNRVLIDIDPRSVTAAALCGRLDQIVLMPIFALSASMMTIVGQNIGRGRPDRARKAWRTGVILAVTTTAVIAAVVMVAAPWIYRLFSTDDTVLSYTVKQTRMVELSFVAAALVIMARSVFQALGRPLPGLVITFLRMVVFVVPFILFFVYVLDWGLYGVWGGMIAGNLLGGAVSAAWVRNYWNRLESGRTDYVHTGT